MKGEGSGEREQARRPLRVRVRVRGVLPSGVLSSGVLPSRSDVRVVAAIRRGEAGAFDAVYHRHADELLRFCVYLAGSMADAEDALQTTFGSAYRALLADSRPVALRPWLFTIARNECLSLLRQRRELVELNGEAALTGDPVRTLELREDVAATFAAIRSLPESQRTALVLAEMHGLKQADIANVLGVRAEQVKAYIYQARSNLVSEREGREVDCGEIRRELASAHGAARLRRRLRRHLSCCEACRSYAQGISRRQHLGALLPIIPSLALKYEVLQDALSVGGNDPAACANGAMATGGPAAEVAGGGLMALVAKVATGMAVVGASTSVGVSVLSHSSGPSSPARSASASLAGKAGYAGGSADGSADGSAGSTRAASSSRQSTSRARRNPRAAGSGRSRRGSSGPTGPILTAGTGPDRATPGAGSTGTSTSPSPPAGAPTEQAAPATNGSEGTPAAGAGQPTTESDRPQPAETGSGSAEQGRQAREKHEQEAQERREEHEREAKKRREEREAKRHKEGPTVTSGAPESEEERLKKREERKKKHEEHKREREERKREREERQREEELLESQGG